jgi:hypothetical protein
MVAGIVMKWHRELGRTATLVVLTLALVRPGEPLHGTVGDTQPAIAPAAVYDANPSHLWNRVHSCLFIRRGPDGAEYGADIPDPLLWQQTKHLLTGESHHQAIQCLDEFLKTHGEDQVQDPIKRAAFQHELWAVFDWAEFRPKPYSRHPQALRSRLGQIMRRVALTPEQVRKLPDTYEEAVASRQFPAEYDPAQPTRAFLPPDLFRPDGPWICLTGYSAGPTALMHFTGRSRFLVFMRLPGGRGRTLEYVRSLRASGEPPRVKGDGASGNAPAYLNLKLPQFPVGTEVALVRQMLVMDAEGNLAATPITESVQLRVYHAVTPGTRYMNDINGPSSHDQDPFEFRFSRATLFARHSGGLTAVRPEDTEYRVVFTQGIDPFESPDSFFGRPSVILDNCRHCHGDSGIHSVQSRLRWMNRNEQTADPAWEASLAHAIEWETSRTIERKQQQFEFRLLQQYWSRGGSPK